MILTEKDTLCNRYIRKRIEKYKKNKIDLINSEKPIGGVAVRKWLHPLLIKVLHIKSLIVGLTYEIISEEKNVVKDKTVIYAISHIGKCDLEMIYESCDLFAYVFAGDWELMYATIDDYFLRAKGVIWIDTSDKEDRKNSFKYMTKALKQGIPIMIYPEGMWNLTENLPMMKIFPGTVQAAKECNVPVVPIAIEQVEKRFLINIGKEMCFDDIEETEAMQILRDTLASLKWEIWEYLPREKRRDIQEDYYEKFLQERIAEFKGFNKEVIESRRYRDKTDREIMEIKRDLEKLRNR